MTADGQSPSAASASSMGNSLRERNSVGEFLIAQGVEPTEASRRAVRTSVEDALDMAIARFWCPLYPFWLHTSFTLLLSLLFLLWWSWSVYQQHADDYGVEALKLMLRLLYITVALKVSEKAISQRMFSSWRRDGPLRPCCVKLLHFLTYVLILAWPVAAGWILCRTHQCISALQEADRVIRYVGRIYGAGAVAWRFLDHIDALPYSPWLDPSADPKRAAPEGFVNQLPVVTYEPSIFDDERGVYPAACPICLDPFDAARPITRVPCVQNGHAFHQGCLDNWLQCARTCPLCRTDVTSSADA